MPEPDPYAVLGIDRNASAEQIQQAYRRAAQKLHPDRNPNDPDATRKMQRINTARDKTLSCAPRTPSAASSEVDSTLREDLRAKFEDLVRTELNTLQVVENYLWALRNKLHSLSDDGERRTLLETHCCVLASFAGKYASLCPMMVPFAIAERTHCCASPLFDTLLKVAPRSFTADHYNAYIHEIGKMPPGSAQRIAQSAPLRRLISARPDLVMSSGAAYPFHTPPRDVWSL
ncbi:MAG TPA: J domain-containing protein [Alphaproteobacteria bacterium]|nr:J domain-containing protein [Alphaproteobacteria bacterium]